MESKSRQRSSALRNNFLIGLIIVILVVIFSFTAAHQSIENKLMDLRFQLRQPIPVSDQIVNIDIDDYSISQLGRWPWTRDRHANLIEVLKELGAKAAAFDVDFYELSENTVNSDKLTDNIIPLLEKPINEDLSAQQLQRVIGDWKSSFKDAVVYSDAPLSDSIKSFNKVYLTCGFPKDKTALPARLPDSFISGRMARPSGVPLAQKPYENLQLPIEIFARHAKGLGFDDISPDSDGILRRVTLVKEYQGYLYPQLAFRVIYESMGINPAEITVIPGNRIILGKSGVAIPIDDEGRMLINWAGNREINWEDTFTHEPFVKFIPEGIKEALDNINSPKRDELSPMLMKYSRQIADPIYKLAPIIKDKICFVGMIATANTDMKPTPIAPMVPGVMLHSNLINMIVTNNFIHQTPKWINILIVLICGMLVAFIAAKFNPLISSTGTLIIIAISVAGAFFLFSYNAVLIDLTSPILVSFFGFASITTYRTISEEKAKRQVQTMFGHYLSPHVINELIQDPSKLKLGGEKRVMSVFFSDIANFTNSTAGLAPEVITEYVNRYLTAMTDIIQEHDGMIDKYEGDAIMALFGAPIARPDHAKLACWSALDNLKKLIELNAHYKKVMMPQINIRIGVNSGEMVVGNLGSARVLSYTVMGEEVILASRLEGVNKFYQTKILISEETFQQAKDFIEAREVDYIRAKGMTKAVRVYELLARKGEVDPATIGLITQYASALQAYRARQWDTAIELFNNCLDIKPNDGPSLTLIQQCQICKQNQSGAKWDGINTLTAK